MSLPRWSDDSRSYRNVAAHSLRPAAMNTFRRCLAVAALILTCLYFLHSSHSVPPQIVPYKGTSAQPSSVAAPKQETLRTPSLEQKDFAQRPLRERLRHQFPYRLESKIPAYIWQTWKYGPDSGRFSDNLRPMEATWTEAHPGFIHQVVSDNNAPYLIRYLYAGFPDVIEAYESMPLPVLKADFFRYLILLARGGIYTDIDTYVLQPTTEWLPKGLDRSTVGLIVGIEADPDRPDWDEWYSRRIQFCQWTIQSKPGHPILRDVVANITEEALGMKRAGRLTESKMDKTIVEFTGPAVWTDAIFRYLNNPGYFDMAEENKRDITPMDFTGIKAQKKVGDVIVLPITSFSPGVQQMGAEELDHPMAFVKHEFEGMY